MGLLQILFHDPATFFVLVVLLLYSIILHEVAHGYVAFLFGDNTARYAGRLSLNPVTHIDPFGTLALFLVGFGWANPVPVNYYNLRNYRTGIVCVALAGVGTNIALATIALLMVNMGVGGGSAFFTGILVTVARINIMLGAFNLIPIPPLDGSKVLTSFLSPDLQYRFSRIEPYGFFILIGLLVTGLLDPVIATVQSGILIFISAVVGVFR